MITPEKLAALEAYIRQTAARKIATDGDDDEDDFNPMDFSGGNFDDCFDLGARCGEVEFARELLEFFE